MRPRKRQFVPRQLGCLDGEECVILLQLLLIFSIFKKCFTHKFKNFSTSRYFSGTSFLRSWLSSVPIYYGEEPKFVYL